MQKTCGPKENKTCHSVTGRLTQGRGPAPAVGPGSEDWARPGFRGLSQTRAPRMSQTPARLRPRPRPRGSARPLPAGPGRRRRHSLFPARKRTRHSRLFIYGGFSGVCAVCLGLVFSFFFFSPVLKSDFGIFLHSFASPAFVPSVSGKRCGAPGPRRGTLCFFSQPVLFPALRIAEDAEQEHEKLCPGQKKKGR